MRENRRRFWMVTLVRGGLAILAGCFVMVTADLDRTILLVSVGVAVAVATLAVYGMVDSVLLLASSAVYPHRWPRTVMQLQGIAGLSVGVLLLTLLFDHAGVEWFLPLAVVQAFSTAGGEFLLLKHNRARRWAAWDFAGAFVATCFGFAYTTLRIRSGTAFSPAELATAIYLYLLLFGLAQTATALRMLLFRAGSLSRGLDFSSGSKLSRQ